MERMLQFLLLLSSIFSRLACATLASGCAKVPAIYVFGDSLADVGNNNNLATTAKANFPHNGIDFPGGVATGRFSNGYIGVDYLAMMLGFNQSPPSFVSLQNGKNIFQGVNFASGGSGILDSTGTSITFTTQIMNFKNVTQSLIKQRGKKEAKYLLTKSIFLISTGNNDMFSYFSSIGHQNATTDQNFSSNLAYKFMKHIMALYKAGARKFGIFGLSHIGCVPFLRSRNPSGKCIEELNNMAQQFNFASKGHLHHLTSILVGMKYSYGNFYKMTSLVDAKPQRYGYKELKIACCGSGKFNGMNPCTPNATYCLRRQDYYFWDLFHPTEATYKLMATRAFNGSRSFATPINIKTLLKL